MAKQMTDDKAKVKFIFLEVEGGSAALQDTVRAVAATLSRPTPVRTTLLPAAARTVVSTPEQDVEPQQPGLFDGPGEQPEAVSESAKASRPRTPPKPRSIPEIIPDLDVTTGEISLASYIEKKQPDTAFNKYLVIAHWLREYKAINSVSVSHIFTCYRGLKWTPPNDPSQPLRDLCKKHRQYMTGDGTGSYSLTILGMNEVERMGTSEA